MAAFPDNEVGILPDYFPATPAVEVAQKLAAPGVIPAVVVPAVAAFDTPGLFLNSVQKANQQRAAATASARRRLRDLLRAAADDLRLLEEVTDDFKQRKFDEARGSIDALSELPPHTVASIDRQTITTALAGADMPYFDIQIHIIPGPGPDGEHEVKTKVPRTLKGYHGPSARTGQGELVVALADFVSGGPERRFRLALLTAEALVGEARAEAAESNPEALYREAIRTYAPLVPKPPAVLIAQQRLVVMRSAAAQIALGDFLYRRAFRPNDAQSDAISQIYVDALEFLVASGLATDAFAGLALHVNDQLERLRNHVNALGYTDRFVPNLRLSTLSDRALRRIEAASDASRMFHDLERGLDAVLQEIAALDQKEFEERLGVEIAMLREENAASQADAAEEQRQAIQDKLSDLDLGLATGIAQSIFATIARGPEGTELGAEFDGPGLASTLVAYDAARTELGHQARIAGLGEEIARRDERIARIQTQIAESRVAFVQDALASRRFLANRLYVLTNAWEELTRRHVAAAFEFLYLFERGIAFRRFTDRHVVEAASADPLLAPGPLRAIHAELSELAKADGKGQNAFALPPISLKRQYPLEFGRFLQSGSMEFVISLYDVEQHLRLSGHCNIRIKNVAVELPGGLIPPTGFIGTLIHRGVMMFRDAGATLAEPRPTRLVPTGEELEAAAQELARGTAQRALVGGVVLMALDQDALRFSSETDTPVPGSEEDFDLEPIENYGLTGTWFLGIEGMNLRTLDDVLLKFTVSLEERDLVLQPRVDELIGAYEDELRGADELDRIFAFSLKGRDSDAYFALESGAGSFELREQDFDSTLTDLKVKAVVVQALDGERSGVPGVALEVRSGSLTLARSTREDGFSEDVTADIPLVPREERPTILGSWEIRLPQPDQFPLMGQAGDLRLFFVYEFTEVG